jgi:hypothetical protein
MLLLTLGLSLCGGAIADHLRSAQPHELPTETPTVLGQIRELAELTVLEVPMSRVVRAQRLGRVGGVRVLVQVHGTATFATDLSQAQIVHIDASARHVTLIVPSPRVRTVRLDAKATEVLRVDRLGLWPLALGPAQEAQTIAQALAQGETTLRTAIATAGLHHQAKRQTRRALNDLLADTGWSCTIQWNG